VNGAAQVVTSTVRATPQERAPHEEGLIDVIGYVVTGYNLSGSTMASIQTAELEDGALQRLWRRRRYGFHRKMGL